MRCNIIIIISTFFLNVLGSVTIFQAIDQSFFNIWVNWHLIAHEVKIFPQYKLHLACFGRNIANIVSLVHTPGCSQIFNGTEHTKKIYLYKWIAVTNALRMEGSDLLVIDVDALLIKDPLWIFQTYGSFDIVSSRDHGPPDLPLGSHWGNGRLCTGFIYFRYSTPVMELVELTLARCRLYGHDQISFNSILSQAATSWDEPAGKMRDEHRVHQGFIPWIHQKDPDWTAIRKGSIELTDWEIHRQTALKLLGNGENSTSNPRPLSILMLDKYSALRYCHKDQQQNGANPTHMWIYDLQVENFTPEQLKRLTALHCFVHAGPLGEQGEKKREFKINIMLALNTWVIKDELTDAAALLRFLRRTNFTDGDANYLPSNFLMPDSPGTLRTVQRLLDPHRMDTLKKVWIQGDASKQINYLNLTRPGGSSRDVINFAHHKTSHRRKSAKLRPKVNTRNS